MLWLIARRSAAVVLVAALAPDARGAVDVCNPTIPYTLPDHDQVRASIFTVVGLQGNGTQYCVPTCTTDILTYLQNHGYPNLNMGSGPGPWLGNGTIYNAFSNGIESLAGLMNTDPAGGTGGDDAFAGVNQWIANSGYTGDIVVSMFGMSGNTAPELGDVAFCLIARCPISISVGWYQNMGSGNYIRRGGHCVAVSRLPDFCTPFPKISIRDPGTSFGSDQFSQAAGTTETYSVVPNLVIVRRDADDNSVQYSGPAVNIVGFGSANRTAIIDGYRAYFPAFGLSACNNPVNGSCVMQHVPNGAFTGLPHNVPISFPAGSSVLDLDIAADSLSSWAVVRSGSGDYGIWRSRFGSGQPAQQSIPAMAPFSPRRVCTGREPRVLYFLDNNPHLVVRLNTATGVAMPMSLADAASAICFDDKRNELVCFSGAARRVTRLDADTLAPVSVRVLPTSVAVGPEPRIAICPVGSYLWLTSGLTTGYGMLPGNAGDDLLIAGTVSFDQPLHGVDTNDRGHVFTTAGGLTLEFEPPTPGPTTVLAWARVDGPSPFAGLGDGPIFRIARSRTNYSRAIHSRPEEMLDILPELVARSIPDCPADFNFSGSVSVQDLFDFLAAYFDQDLRADMNESGAITVQDIFDFLAAYFAGC